MATQPKGYPYSWLRRQPLKQMNGSEKTINAVLASGAVVADANGRKLLEAGRLLCQITSGDDTGKWGPYLQTASDGRQTLAVGYAAVLVSPLELTLYDMPFAGYIADCVFDKSELTLGGLTLHADLAALKAAFPQATFWD